MSNEQEAAYLRTVSELQELARRAPHVRQDYVLQVACMDPMEMRRRLIRSQDWHGHFSHSLDGIPEIQAMPGSGIDGCRMHKEVRAVVLGLLEQIKQLQLAEEGAAEAFGAVVQDKRALEAEVKRLQSLLDGAYASIRKYAKAAGA